MEPILALCSAGFLALSSILFAVRNHYHGGHRNHDGAGSTDGASDYSYHDWQYGELANHWHYHTGDYESNNSGRLSANGVKHSDGTIDQCPYCHRVQTPGGKATATVSNLKSLEW